MAILLIRSAVMVMFRLHAHKGRMPCAVSAVAVLAGDGCAWSSIRLWMALYTGGSGVGTPSAPTAVE